MTSIFVCDDESLAGRIVYWTLSGVVEFDAFIEALEIGGIQKDLFPLPQTPDRALKRAVESILVENKMIARPIKALAGQSLFREEQKPQRVRLSPELTVHVRDVGGYIPGLVFSPEGHDLEKLITQRFARAITELDTISISGWIHKVLTQFSAVTMRAAGGFYFIPKAELSEWYRHMEPLQKTSRHKIYALPAVNSQDVIAAVLDALEAETKQVASELEVELQTLDLGVRALTFRAGKCDRMISKFERYEGILGQKLENLRKVFDTLKAQTSTMILMATPDQEAQEAV
jgi:hypothetical protein